MKKIIISCLLSFLTFTIHAQTGGISPSAKTTQLKERVIAQATYQNGVLQDSTRYIYKHKNFKGSTFDYDILEYRTQAPFPAGFYLIDNTPKYHSKPSLFADTIISYNSANVPQSEIDVAYDSNYNVISHLSINYQGGDIAQTIANFNSQNQPTYIEHVGTQNNIPVGTQEKHFLAYSQNRLTTDSLFTATSTIFSPASVYQYLYDNAGNNTLISIFDTSGNNNFRYVNSYTPDNYLATTAYDYLDSNNGWLQETGDSFAYFNGSSLRSHWYSGAYRFTENYNYIMSGAGLIDSFYGHTDLGTAPSNIYNSILNYDIYNNPVYQKYTQTAPSISVIEYYYYYETYDPAAVSNVAPASRTITIYPNPATNMVSISGIESTTGITISLVDIAGKLIMKQNALGNTGVQSLSLKDRLPGTYILNITDGTGLKLYSGKALKQ